jgi:hypothetical protein
MNRGLNTLLLLGAAALVVSMDPISSAAAEVCVYEQAQTEPYYVLGSRVQPQSSILIAGACNSSFEAVSVDYVNAARTRLKPNGQERTAAQDCRPDHRYKRGCASTEQQ